MIFLTGGTGLVGAHVLLKLLQAGEHVRALKRPNSNLRQVVKTFSYYTDQAEALFNRIEWVEGDILDYHSIEDLLAGVTDVYHCAAMVSFHPNDRDSMLNNNVKGTANIIDAALFNQVQRFCHVSSIAALGKTQDGTEIDEETYWVPSKQKSAYSLSKFFSEMEVWRGIEEGLQGVIVNPSIILGPGNWNIGSPKFFQTIWKGLKYYTKGESGHVDVRDVADAMTRLMQPEVFEQVKNQRFILNAGNISYQELFNKIADSLERPRPKTFVSDLTLKFAWRAARLASLFSGKPPLLTRDTATGKNQISHYNGNKIKNQLGFNYRSIDESVQDISKLFLEDVEQMVASASKR